MKCRLRYSCLALLLLLTGCRQQETNETLHPLLDRIQGPFTYTLVRDEAQRLAPDALPIVQRLIRARLLHIIGTYIEGAPEYLFGRVIDAALDPRGRIAVLDAVNGEVRFFDADGRFLFKVGRSGEGPGEFDYPERLAFDRQGRLYVLDGSRRIQRFRPKGDSLFVLEHTYSLFDQLGTPAHDFCLIGDTLYVQTMPPAWWEQPILHALTLSGERIRSFGLLDFYPPNLEDSELYQILQQLLGEASLYCDPYSPGLILLYPYFGVIAYYSTEGTRRWLMRIGDPPIRAHKLLDQGGMPVLRPRGFAVHNILVLPDHRILLHGSFQVMSKDDPYTVSSSEEYVYLLNNTGENLGWAPVAFPFFRVYQLTSSQLLGTKPNEEAPHVAIFHLEEPLAMTR